MHTLKRCMAAMVALLALSLAMTARAELPDFTPLVEQASPAVVNISTRQKLPDRAMARGQLSIPDLEGLPPMFRDFLERSIPQVPRNPRGQQREAQSLGSGFIISNDGYILTNNHVVADADEILVRLSDRSEHKAKLIGADPRSDVAVLKIERRTCRPETGRFEQAESGRMGPGHRFAVRLRSLGHRRYRQCQGS